MKKRKLTILLLLILSVNTNDFGEQISFSLPNSGCKVYVSSTYDIGANGDETVLAPVYPDVEVTNNTLQFAINWLK